MTCERCDGLMLVDISPAESDSYERLLTQWHCYICGERIDNTILYNRTHTPKLEHMRRGYLRSYGMISQRRLIFLHETQGLSFKEISDMLGHGKSFTIMMRYRKAKRSIANV